MCKTKNCNCKRRRKQYTKRKQHGGNVLGTMKSKISNRIFDRIKKNALKPKSKKNFDIHGKTLGAVNKIFGSRGAVLPGYKYAGPGNDLSRQLLYNKKGKITKFMVKPSNELDRIAANHDVCYSLKNKSKNKCDLEMLYRLKKSKKKIPPIAGAFVKGIIGTKAYLNL